MTIHVEWIYMSKPGDNVKNYLPTSLLYYFIIIWAQIGIGGDSTVITWYIQLVRIDMGWFTASTSYSSYSVQWTFYINLFF